MATSHFSCTDCTNVKVKVTQFPGMGYGLRLKRSVQKNELVLTVPVSAMMTVESAKKGPLNTFISQEPLLTAMPNLALALHLLNERYSQDSAWRPFISECFTQSSLPLMS